MVCSAWSQLYQPNASQETNNQSSLEPLTSGSLRILSGTDAFVSAIAAYSYVKVRSCALWTLTVEKHEHQTLIAR